MNSVNEMHAPVELADIAADVLARLRTRAPRVHCITNSVAQQFTANVLLAAGAVPSMTISPGEIGSFVTGADALLVNLGTFDAERRTAIDAAISAAKAGGKPWVLDPVFVERAPPRAQFARDILIRGPAIVRLNAAEFAALSDHDPAGDGPARFARANTTVVAVTGGVDRITDGARHAVIANGDPLMGQVTAMGCAGSALVAAVLAVETDPFIAARAALTAFGVAGEVAALDSEGPGSFAAAILDALYGLDRATLRQRARVS
jgi:hydroxyethylthiazole kinase